MTPSNWAEASPSPWFVDAARDDGHLVNLGSRALVAQGLAVDVADGVQTIRRRLIDAGVPGSSIQVADAALHLDASVLPQPDTDAAFARLTQQARSGPASGTVIVGGERWDAATLFETAGRDAVTWAWLRCARPSAQPPSLEPGAHVLASRRDDNPLALVRRAHARLALHDAEAPGDTRAQTSAPDMATALALVHQASMLTVRAGRTSPLCLAVEDLARASLRAAERETSESRTDLTWVRRARRVLAGALNAAAVAAPVPY